LKKLALTFAAAAALIAGASRASTPAYPDSPDVIWKGNFEEGATSLSGNCSYGANGWCGEQSVRAQQRFRTTLRDSRDLVYIFLAIVVGFAAGVQSLAVGAVVSIIFNFVLIITWRYDYGRNMLMPTAAAQWSRPLQALASPTGDHQVPDRDLLLSLTPEKANALADRFDRVRAAMGKKKKARYNSVLTITTDDVPDAQKQVEEVLDRMTKRWDLDEVVTNVGKPCELYYLIRLKKSMPRDVLLTAIHENADGIIGSAALETADTGEDKSATKG
jgi:hypothetical protein